MGPLDERDLPARPQLLPSQLPDLLGIVKPVEVGVHHLDPFTRRVAEEETECWGGETGRHPGAPCDRAGQDRLAGPEWARKPDEDREADLPSDPPTPCRELVLAEDHVTLLRRPRP